MSLAVWPLVEKPVRQGFIQVIQSDAKQTGIRLKEHHLQAEALTTPKACKQDPRPPLSYLAASFWFEKPQKGILTTRRETWLAQNGPLLQASAILTVLKT